jgi:flavin-dependent dehydrogenase
MLRGDAEGTKMATDFDLVIVGGSFSGLVCARTAALRGLRVAVLERKREPGAGVVTTGVLVKEAADALDLPVGLGRKVRGVALYGPSGRRQDLDSPGYYFLATDAGGLLRWLALDAALAGARLLCGTPFRGACYETEGLRLAGCGLTTRYLIGADGARSQVARCFRLGTNERLLEAVELHLPLQAGLEPDRLHCFLGQALAPGHIGWAVPGVESLQVGVASRASGEAGLAAVLDKVAALTGCDLGQARERRCGVIPVGGPVRPFATDRVMLIGDAAGLVSPLTGGGIHNAFRFGRRAAQAVSDHLQDQGPEPSRVMVRELPSYLGTALLRRAMDAGVPDAAFDLLIGSPLMERIASAIFFRPRGLPGPHVRAAFRPAPVLRTAGGR